MVLKKVTGGIERNCKERSLNFEGFISGDSEEVAFRWNPKSKNETEICQKLRGRAFQATFLLFSTKYMKGSWGRFGGYGM